MSDDKIEAIRARHVLYPPSRHARHSHRVAYQDIATLLAEVERLQKRDAEWTEKAAAWLSSAEAAQRLDGYRELAARVNELTLQRDEARAEIERLRARVEQLDQVREAALNASADWYLSLRVDQRDSIEYVEPNIGLMGSMSKLFEIAWDATPATQNATGARGKP